MIAFSRVTSVAMLCLLFIVGIAQARADAASRTTPAGTLLVLGDSLSASYGIEQASGWVSLLKRRLAASHPGVTVVNASISGDTSTGGRARLGALLQEHNPHWVVLELGGNDGLQGHPLPALEANLAAMIDMIRAEGAAALLLGIRIPPNYGRRYTEGFERVYQRLSDEKNVPLVPFILDGVAGHEDIMQRDGIHPTAEAQPRILDNVWPAITTLLGQNSAPARTGCIAAQCDDGRR